MPKRRAEKLHCFIPFDDRELDKLDKAKITDDDRFIFNLMLRPQHNEYPKDWPRRDHILQEEFARLMGMDPSAVSRLIARGILTRAMPWRIWMIQWRAYYQGLAAGRRGSGY